MGKKTAANKAPDASQEATGGTKGKSKDIYYLFKADTYVDDDPREAKLLVPAGFYRVGRVLPRLERFASADIVKFDGRPDDIFIADIARARGMHVVAGQKVDYDKLLDGITNKYPFE